MRIHGKVLRGPKTEILVIPRDPTITPKLDAEGKETGEFTEISNDIVFQARAVMDMDEFDLLNPTPSPPPKLMPGNPPVEGKNYEDPKYQEAMNLWTRQKSTWMILKSLAATEGLEWETVDLSNPETYPNYLTELRDGGFNDQEVNMIVGLALKVNSIDESRMEEARKRFLASRAAPPLSS